MPFTITVTESRIETDVKQEHTIVGTKEVAREKGFCADKDAPDTRIDNVYGWTKPVEGTKTVEVERLKQTVETLDLQAVIKAVNGL